MSDERLTETVTVTREVPQEIRDLVQFAKGILEGIGFSAFDDATLVAKARAFWDRQHGED